MNSVLRIALVDAAKNCSAQGATATITLKSGVQISGALERPSNAFPDTAHIQKRDGGWATFDGEEIAMVETTPKKDIF